MRAVPGEQTGSGTTRVLRAIAQGFPVELNGLTADIGTTGTLVGVAVEAFRTAFRRKPMTSTRPVSTCSIKPIAVAPGRHCNFRPIDRQQWIRSGPVAHAQEVGRHGWIDRKTARDGTGREP